MGFGGQTQTGATNQTQTKSYPDWLTNAAGSNINFAQGLQQSPFQPYTGQRVADFMPLQSQAMNQIASVAGSPNPWAGTTANLINQYATTPLNPITAPQIGAPQGITASSVNTGAIPQINSPTMTATGMLGGGDPANTSLQTYMSPYIQSALEPTLRNIERAHGVMRTGAGGIDSGATSAGAYGDARNGIELAEDMRNQGMQESDASAQAYDRAFTQAANMRQTDVNNVQGARLASGNWNMAGQQANAGNILQSLLANAGYGQQASMFNAGQNLQSQLANAGYNMAGQQFNSGLQQQQLANALGGANAYTSLDQYLTGRGLNMGNTLLGLGNQQQGLYQQMLNAPYQDYLSAQQWPFQTTQLVNQAIGAGTGAAPVTSTGTGTTMAPDNSGYGILGSIGGGLSNALARYLGTTAGSTALTSLFGLSDRNAKTDIRKIATDDETGIPVYAFRYKGDPKSYPKVVGPMAQDVEKVAPWAVSKVGKYKAIDRAFLEPFLGRMATAA